MLKKADLLLTVALLVMAGIFFAGEHLLKNGSAAGAKIARITHNGKIIRIIDLNRLQRPVRISIDQGIKIVIQAERGRIRFLKSGCRDKICVKAGWLSKRGDKAVCLPSRTVIMIGGDQLRPMDSISY
jgi:hypothetical protein